MMKWRFVIVGFPLDVKLRLSSGLVHTERTPERALVADWEKAYDGTKKASQDHPNHKPNERLSSHR